MRFGVSAQTVGPIWDELAAAGDWQRAARRAAQRRTRADRRRLPRSELRSAGHARHRRHRGGRGHVVALLAPPEPGEVAAAVEQLAGRKLLQGIRGGPPVDIDALAQIAGTVADLLARDPNVAEVDCNPVMVCRGHSPGRGMHWWYSPMDKALKDMKMQELTTYLAPRHLEEALQAMADGEATVFCGHGTSHRRPNPAPANTRRNC